MSDNHKTCPVCQVTELSSMRCRNASCAFVVAFCSRCDREQAVNAFVADHEKDCVHNVDASAVIRSTFSAPRRAA